MGTVGPRSDVPSLGAAAGPRRKPVAVVAAFAICGLGIVLSASTLRHSLGKLTSHENTSELRAGAGRPAATAPPRVVQPPSPSLGSPPSSPADPSASLGTAAPLPPAVADAPSPEPDPASSAAGPAPGALLAGFDHGSTRCARSCPAGARIPILPLAAAGRGEPSDANCACRGVAGRSGPSAILLDPSLVGPPRPDEPVIGALPEPVAAPPAVVNGEPPAPAVPSRPPPRPPQAAGPARASAPRIQPARRPEPSAAERESKLRDASFREAAPPPGSAPGVQVFHVTPDGGRRDPSGARIIIIR